MQNVTQETGWMPSHVEILEEDLTSAFETHEAIVAGLSRLLLRVREMGPTAPREQGERVVVRCA